MVHGTASVPPMDRLSLINQILGTRPDGRRYLEIGVRTGKNFWRVEARTKIGVDPAIVGRRLGTWSRLSPPRTSMRLRHGTFVFAETSDAFFSRRQRLLHDLPLDAVLVDGLHTAEQAERDVINSLAWLADGGTIVMHDCNPSTATRALPSLSQAIAQPDYAGEWNGDVWKAVVRLRRRPDLRTFTYWTVTKGWESSQRASQMTH